MVCEHSECHGLQCAQSFISYFLLIIIIMVSRVFVGKLMCLINSSYSQYSSHRSNSLSLPRVLRILAL